MFECTECRRTYSSQNSLTRHTHNHGKSKQYLCSICNVVFYRADLHARHMNLHKTPASAESEPSAPTGKVAALDHRRRCHTACIRCRQMRVKCSSQRPCHACTAAGKPCKPTRDTNRISRARVSPAVDSSQAQHEIFAQLSPPRSNPDGQLASKDASMVTGASLNSESLGNFDRWFGNNGSGNIDTSRSDQAFFMPQSGISNTLAEEASLDAGGLPLQTQQLWSPDDVSWPWLHENLFLASDAMLSWPQVDPPDASATQPNLPDFLSERCNERPGFLSQSWEHHASGTDHLALGQSVDPTENGPSFQSIPSANTLFPSTGGHNQVGGRSTLWQCETPQIRDASRLAQAQEITRLITYASNATSASQPRSGRNAFWRTMSPKVAAAFGFPSLSGPHALDQLLQLYLDHFGPLWPLLSRLNLDPDSLHPLLYLVLTSIGAMYGTATQSIYGRMMHNAIRKPLMLPLEFEDSDDEFLWLAQARLLTQVAALYFGQPKAFSYAQHLGCLLVAQARRMDIFAPVHAYKGLEHENDLGELQSNLGCLDLWLHQEARRRLAFGIFRGDTYTSVLLGIKPLVSPEEIDLELPACDPVWRGKLMEPVVCLQLIEQDRTLGRLLRFSDIYHIAMDRNEPLPALEPPAYELLLFALQRPLWRFSRDLKMFERLTGQDRDHSSPEGQGTTTSQPTIRQPSYVIPETSSNGGIAISHIPADHLNDSPRQMSDLKHEADKLTSALHKWKQSLSFVKTLVQDERDRSSVLSSLLLYHLSYMRLHAPVGDLHQIEYQLADGRTVGKSLVALVYQWANAPQSYLAAQHACHIWELITKEAQMPDKIRAKFNLLAFTGLHHAATVLWSYAGAAQDARQQDPRPGGNPLLKLHPPDPAEPSIRICRMETRALLESFVRLYSLISPARWSSFAQAAVKLSESRFPLPADQSIE